MMKLDERFCLKLLKEDFEKLENYSTDELKLIAQLALRTSEVMPLLEEDLAIKLYKEHTLFICETCFSHISDFHITELLVAIKTMVAECIFQAAYVINSSLKN